MKTVYKLYTPLVQISRFLLQTHQIRYFTLQNCARTKSPNWGSKKQHRNIKLQLLEAQKMGKKHGLVLEDE